MALLDPPIMYTWSYPDCGMYVCTYTDVQPCEDNICLHGGNCTQAVLTTTCDCPEGFSGTLCENSKSNH